MSASPIRSNRRAKCARRTLGWLVRRRCCARFLSLLSRPSASDECHPEWPNWRFGRLRRNLSDFIVMSATTRSLARTLLLLCAAGSVLSCASADPDPGVGVVRSGIAGGQPDSVDSNVFILVSHRGATVALCSASLIAPNLLLTARHCVSSVPTDVVTCGQTEASP